MKLLNSTGSGLSSVDGVHRYAESYIGPSGPDTDTSEGVSNIWGVFSEFLCILLD